MTIERITNYADRVERLVPEQLKLQYGEYPGGAAPIASVPQQVVGHVVPQFVRITDYADRSARLIPEQLKWQYGGPEAPPIVDFNFEYRSETEVAFIPLINKSYEDIQWDFGDEQTSVENRPVHQFAEDSLN